MEHYWYVLQVKSGCENQIKNKILEQAKMYNISDHFSEIKTPTIKKDVFKNGKKVTVDANIKLGYMFLNMSMTDEALLLLKNIKGQGIVKLLGEKNGNPTIVSQKEVDRILEGLELKSKANDSNIELEVGSNVYIKEGAFQSFTGKVEKIEKDKSKVHVSVSILGRVLPIDLPFNQVKKV